MTARPGEAGTVEATAYTRKLAIQEAREPVFDAIATLDGLRSWWTTTVAGSPAPGGTLRFGFAGLDEQIVMRVDTVLPPAAITWSCVAHTRHDEWTGSTVRFGLADRGPRACELNFRHAGIARELVAEGWDHFLASLAAYAEHGTGSPYGAEPADPARPEPAAAGRTDHPIRHGNHH